MVLEDLEDLENSDNVYEGKCPIGRPSPMTPWGKKAQGVKTRRTKKASSKLIVRRRNDK